MTEVRIKISIITNFPNATPGGIQCQANHQGQFTGSGSEMTANKVTIIIIIIIIIMAASAELHVLGSNPCGLLCMRGARLRWSRQYHPVGCPGRW